MIWICQSAQPLFNPNSRILLHKHIDPSSWPVISWAACYRPIPTLPLTSHLYLVSTRFAVWILATRLGVALIAEVFTIAAGINEGYAGGWDDWHTCFSESPTSTGAESTETGWGPTACLRNLPRHEDHDLG